MAYRQYPPPDPDGRHSIRIDFNLGGDLPELDLGTGGASIGSIREQQLELSEGLQVVLFEDEGDEWMLVVSRQVVEIPLRHPRSSRDLGE
jgi:hypothetical protein